MAGDPYNSSPLGASTPDVVRRNAPGIPPELYSPNRIPHQERTANIIISVFLLLYGSIGVWIDDLYLPAKRGRGIHLHGVPAWVMYGAMLCGCAVLLSVVLDHYDRRDNEVNYRIFAHVGRYCGWGLFFLSLVLYIFPANSAGALGVAPGSHDERIKVLVFPWLAAKWSTERCMVSQPGLRKGLAPAFDHYAVEIRKADAQLQALRSSTSVPLSDSGVVAEQAIAVDRQGFGDMSCSALIQALSTVKAQQLVLDFGNSVVR